MQSEEMVRKPGGRVTPKKGGPAPTPTKAEKWQLDESRQVTRPWAWRGMLFLSLVGIGIGLILLGNHDTTIGVLWMVIAAGWFGFAMLLWRKHSQYIKRG